MGQTTISFLTVIHIASGLLCLLLGPVALISRKGGVLHRCSGHLYIRLMTIMAITAFLLLTVRFDAFFFVLAVFSFYLAFSGYRVLQRKKPDRDQQAKLLDWLAALLAICIGVLSIVLHLAGKLNGDTLFIVLMLGGAITIATYDLVRFLRPVDSSRQPYVWLFEHLSKMIGSYIAVVSAFSATVLGFIPEPARQLWPVVVGLPFMLGVIVRYRRRFRGTSGESFPHLQNGSPEG